MPSFLNLEHLNSGRPFPPPNPPNTIANYRGFQDCSTLVETSKQFRADSQSSKADAKLIHIFPSQVPFPRLLTVPGIEAVSISSILFNIPSGVRNPTMIFGTPRRKDCIQNFMSLRSNATISLSFRMSTLVFNSTQLIGLPSVVLQSHTFGYQMSFYIRERSFFTCIDFTTENHDSISNASSHNGTVLGVIIDDFVLTIFDIFS